MKTFMHEPSRCRVCRDGSHRERARAIRALVPWAIVVGVVLVLGLLEGVTR